MKVFVAGGSGAIGRRLVPLLADAGHDVVASTRVREKSRLVYELGAEPVVLDALDRDAVLAAVVRAEPEVVVHQLTDLGGATNLRNFDRVFRLTNRLRTEGIDHLVEAARAVGARRVVAQSFGNWNYARDGRRVKSEADPLDPAPPHSMRASLEAIRHLESTVVDADGIEGLALRFGNLYGPGTGIAEHGVLVELVRRHQLPIIGDGAGVWSFVHVDDAASATLRAIERGEPGIYNVSDDDPAPARVWVPELAAVLGAKPPRRLPVWLGRLAAGEALASMFTEMCGASNAKARRELGWRLRYPTWRQGFRTGLSDASNPALEAERGAHA